MTYEPSAGIWFQFGFACIPVYHKDEWASLFYCRGQTTFLFLICGLTTDVHTLSSIWLFNNTMGYLLVWFRQCLVLRLDTFMCLYNSKKKKKPDVCLGRFIHFSQNILCIHSQWSWWLMFFLSSFRSRPDMRKEKIMWDLGITTQQWLEIKLLKLWIPNHNSITELNKTLHASGITSTTNPCLFL